MVTQKISLQKLALKGGLLTCVALIVYFMLMKYMGLIQVFELRYLNLVILLGGILLTFRSFKISTQMHTTYLEGFLLGCLTSTISILSFALFVFVYFTSIDPGLLLHLKASAPFLGTYLTPFTAASSIIAEGAVSGLVITTVYMQYYKDKFEA